MKNKRSRIPDPELASGEGSPKHRGPLVGGDPSLRSGIQTHQIIAFPTESFYALGVPADDVLAIKKLFHLKQREPGKPIALIAADLAQVKKFFVMSKAEERLARRYWPGPLTILLKPKSSTTPNPSSERRGYVAAAALLGGLPSLHTEGSSGGRKHQTVRIGVRVPAHAGARKLAQQVGSPLTATSANMSGQPPTKSARVVKRNFPGILLAPGRCGKQSLPSTIVELKNTKIHILRPGALNLSRAARVQGSATYV